MTFRSKISRMFRLVFLLLALAGLLVLLPACGGGGDGDPGDPGGGGDDTSAPFVVRISPVDGSLIYDFNTSFYIEFNEEMDHGSAAGNITLSPATSFDISWGSPLGMFLTPSNLPEATEITVTVGPGMTDLAGNGLAAPFTSTYTTIASQLALVGISPDPGTLDVNRNTNIGLMFTEPVRYLGDAVTISDGNKTNYYYSVTDDGRGNYTLNPSDVLPAETEFTVTIGTQVSGIYTGTSLASPESFSFTTGLAMDNTPPSIVGITPASGSTLPVDQGSITIVFDEPMNLANFNPVSMNGQLVWAISESGLEPDLSPDGTVLTVYLPAVLPEGLSLTFVLAGYEDLFGNIQTAETAWAATVAGTPSPLYLEDGYRYTASGRWEEGDLGNNIPHTVYDASHFYEIGARSASDQWELREYDWQFSDLVYIDILSISSTGISQLGFAEDMESGFQEIMISSPILLVELPFAASNNWTSSGSVTLPDGTLNVALEGQVIDQQDLEAGYLDETVVTWTGAWKVVQNVSVSESGQVVDTETIQQWMVPGIGVVREIYHEENFDPDESGWTHFETWRDLTGVLRFR